MDLHEVMTTTPATRDFTDEDLPDADLYAVLDRARFAPSGGNRQGVRVVVVRDLATKRRLAEINHAGARRYVAQIAAGESPWNPVHPPGPTPEQIAATEPPEALVGSVVRAPVVLVIGVDLAVVAATDQDLDRVGLVAGASVYPFVWNVLLAARDAGWGGTITTMAVAGEPQVRELLGLPDTVALAAVVPLGRPVREVRRLRRRAVEEFVTRERFDGPPFSG